MYNTGSRDARRDYDNIQHEEGGDSTRTRLQRSVYYSEYD